MTQADKIRMLSDAVQSKLDAAQDSGKLREHFQRAELWLRFELLMFQKTSQARTVEQAALDIVDALEGAYSEQELSDLLFYIHVTEGQFAHFRQMIGAVLGHKVVQRLGLTTGNGHATTDS